MKLFMPFFFILFFSSAKAGDTLFVHQKYPPLVYENGEYLFYKYNAKYIPSNLLQCFKILGTFQLSTLERFQNRNEEEVIERGIFDRGYRIRKEFCLTSYSNFSQHFHSYNIYAPHCMETFILLAFHQYLNNETIQWQHNRKLSLNDLREENKSWKKRAKHFYKLFKEKREADKSDFNPEAQEDDWIYNW